MVHQEVFKWFELYFPDYVKERIECWFPNGKNSIRLRQINKQEFIFTYNGKDNWRFETLYSFMDRIGKKVEKTMKK